MAHSSECTDQYAPKALDGADIVRDAMLQQLSELSAYREKRPMHPNRHRGMMLVGRLR